MSHVHAPVGAVERHLSAKLGQCDCGIDLVSYLAPIGARHNWEDWKPTALDDPCLSCGDYSTPTCCEVSA